MQIEVSKTGDLIVVKPMDNRLDSSSANDLRGTVVDWVNMGHHLILLDLENVDFIDSSGLAAIVSCFKALGHQGNMAICNVQKMVNNIFNLTRINKILKIFETQAEAIRSLEKLPGAS